MNYYYLKFDTKETMETLFESLGWKHSVEYDEEVTEFYAWFNSDHNNIGTIDIIGEMWNDDAEFGEFNEDGTREVISEVTQIPGYHVNISTYEELPESLTEFLVHPNSPSRITNFNKILFGVDYDQEVTSLPPEE